MMFYSKHLCTAISPKDILDVVSMQVYVKQADSHAGPKGKSFNIRLHYKIFRDIARYLNDQISKETPSNKTCSV